MTVSALTTKRCFSIILYLTSFMCTGGGFMRSFLLETIWKGRSVGWYSIFFKSLLNEALLNWACLGNKTTWWGQLALENITFCIKIICQHSRMVSNGTAAAIITKNKILSVWRCKWRETKCDMARTRITHILWHAGCKAPPQGGIQVFRESKI